MGKNELLPFSCRLLNTIYGISAVAALLHLGCIYFGAPGYRFFGAGEQMAIMAEKGMLQPTIVTLFITRFIAFDWLDKRMDLFVVVISVI